ncbi:hypothetical protein GE061_011991 [Apolygus lucorum]|uniref:SUN domain-containing protein n=1 Tax=Apolygus lucorum TaxID=248454 RepID=A0A8S9XSE1_APOLU|nr:hypothetical protein GE061_011991 [Apolygus lucorum]
MDDVSDLQQNLSSGRAPCRVRRCSLNYCLIIRIVRSVVFGLLVILVAVYLGHLLYTAEIKSCVEGLKEKFMLVKERCQHPCTGNDGGEDFVLTNEAGRVDEQHIRYLVRQVVNEYEVDRTGMTDFAMGALGGQVLSTPNTQTYAQSKGPSTILEPCNLPGDCWAFAGKSGSVVIRLFAKIVVTNVTLEHISRDLSPNGIASAPSIFSMVGLEDPEASTGHNFGSFVYNDNGPPLQTFPVRFTFVPPFEYIKVDFQDNHGHDDFTCIYRIRFHGRRSDKPIRTDRLPPLEET